MNTLVFKDMNGNTFEVKCFSWVTSKEGIYAWTADGSKFISAKDNILWEVK